MSSASIRSLVRFSHSFIPNFLVISVIVVTSVVGVKAGDAEIAAPRVSARAALVYNPSTGRVLWGEKWDEQFPIASITKVMTSIVFTEQRPDLTEEVVVDRSDVRRASVTFLRSGERVTINDLLHLALVASDNAAARVLARTSPWGTDGFIARMNEKAAELELWNTSFTDPSGLDAGNVSSAYDLSRLIVYISKNDQLGEIMRKQSHRIQTNRRRVTLRNTNRLLQGDIHRVIRGDTLIALARNYGTTVSEIQTVNEMGQRTMIRIGQNLKISSRPLNVLAGKTGYIRRAGFCVVALFQPPNSDPVVVVILGAQSNAGRFREARRLLDWFSDYTETLEQD